MAQVAAELDRLACGVTRPRAPAMFVGGHRVVLDGWDEGAAVGGAEDDLPAALRLDDRDGHDDRHLAGEICRACVECLDVDGAAVGRVLTSTDEPAPLAS